MAGIGDYVKQPKGSRGYKMNPLSMMKGTQPHIQALQGSPIKYVQILVAIGKAAAAAAKVAGKVAAGAAKVVGKVGAGAVKGVKAVGKVAAKGVQAVGKGVKQVGKAFKGGAGKVSGKAGAVGKGAPTGAAKVMPPGQYTTKLPTTPGKEIVEFPTAQYQSGGGFSSTTTPKAPTSYGKTYTQPTIKHADIPITGGGKAKWGHFKQRVQTKVEGTYKKASEFYVKHKETIGKVQKGVSALSGMDQQREEPQQADIAGDFASIDYGKTSGYRPTPFTFQARMGRTWSNFDTQLESNKAKRHAQLKAMGGPGPGMSIFTGMKGGIKSAMSGMGTAKGQPMSYPTGAYS